MIFRFCDTRLLRPGDFRTGRFSETDRFMHVRGALFFLQAQRRRAVLEQRHRGGLGQRDGRHAHNHGKVRQPDRQQRGRLAVALFAGGRQQPVHHDGGTGFLVRLVHHRATVQPAALAVHHVLPHAPQVREPSPRFYP